MFILKWIMSLVTGPLLSGALDLAKQKMQNDASLDAGTVNLAVETLRNDTVQRQSANALLTAEQGHWFTRNMRPYLAFTITAPVVKMAVWDKALGQWTGGTSDPLDPNLWTLIITICAAYFGGRTLEKMTGYIMGRKK